MLNSKVAFCKGVFGEAKLLLVCCWRRERVARRTAGVPWKRERRQLEAWGLVLVLQFRKITK